LRALVGVYNYVNWEDNKGEANPPGEGYCITPPTTWSALTNCNCQR